MISQAFDQWLFDEYKTDPLSLSIFRLLYALYLLLFVDVFQLRQLAYVPDAFFHPPYGPLLVLDGFPADWFSYGLEGVAVASIMGLLLGYRTRLASLLTGTSLLVGFGYLYSLGKVNHNILVLLIPFVMAGSNWGARWSVDRLAGRESEQDAQGWPVALVAVSLAVAMGIAGIGKVISGWLDPTLQATQSHFIHQYFVNSRQDLLAPFFLSVKNELFWEVQDWATVILEVGFLGAVLSARWLRGFVVVAVFFHLAVALTMNIMFVQQIPVYALFVEWSRFVPEGRGWEKAGTPALSTGAELGLFVLLAVAYYGLGSGMSNTAFALIAFAALFGGVRGLQFLGSAFRDARSETAR